MSQVRREDNTLHAKVVFYGPARGGKTCNLEALHRLAGSRRGQELLTIRTEKDSTLFFDMLPFDLDDILGQRVRIKLYTVPGQVRNDPTRKVILDGADAIVFVADSRHARREQNVWSLQNLQMNMREKQLDPEHVPLLFQINRRDAEDAAPPAEMSDWLGVSEDQLLPATATRGEGVLETLQAVCCAMLERVLERDAPAVDRDGLTEAIERAFVPFFARDPRGGGADAQVDSLRRPIVLSDDDLLAGAIATSVRLGEERSAEAARARRLALEADGFRRLGESLCDIGAGDDRAAVIQAALEIARDVLDAAVVSLVAESDAGPLTLTAIVGHDEEPLLGIEPGRRLIREMLAADRPSVHEDLAEACGAEHRTKALRRLRSAAAVQVPREGRQLLIVYGGERDGPFEQDDLRFLSSVVRHVAAGLEKARAHDDLALHRDRLERTVAPVPRPQRRLRGSRRAVDRIRERFLANLSKEMQAPLAAVSRAAVALRDYGSSAGERKKLTQALVSSAGLLQRQLKDVRRLIHVVGEEPLRMTRASPRRLVEEAIRISGHEGVTVKVAKSAPTARLDLEAIARAVANLIDNAVRFSPSGKPVQVRAAAGRLSTEDGDLDALVVSVLDQGRGVPEKDRQRIFAPFAQGARGGGRRQRPHRGMGIGLYEAQSLAQRHGGTLEYAPRKGRGSEFRLTVPLEPIAEESSMEVSRV